MLIALAGTALAIVISLLWYLPGIRAQGNNRLLTRKDYLKTAFFYGFCYTCLLIIITEIIWDGVADRMGITGIARDILSSFLRAALLEETFKFTGFLLAKRSLKLTRKIDFIMIAGLIGLVYSVVEKAVLGNIAAVVVGLLIPMHITWQFNQGGHWFEYEKTRRCFTASNPRSCREPSAREPALACAFSSSAPSPGWCLVLARPAMLARRCDGIKSVY